MGEWIGLLIMASALGMDAFSVSVGMGMLGLRLLHIFRIGIMIGLFHLIMPFIGIIIGKFLSAHFELVALLFGAGLLLIVGIHMVITALFSEGTTVTPFGWGLIILAFSVSVDSFSIGLSLGILGAKVIITVGAIAAVSMVFAWGGLLIGRKFHRLVGSYGELLGGFILIGFGLQFLFSILSLLK